MSNLTKDSVHEVLDKYLAGELARDIENEILERIKKKEIDMGIEIVMLKADVASLRSDLKDCANELCLMCGAYKREHEGACDQCRWLPIRKR